jgi:hypothetical protein
MSIYIYRKENNMTKTLSRLEEIKGCLKEERDLKNIDQLQRKKRLNELTLISLKNIGVR